MNWIKKGRIFNVEGNYSWMNSHAQIPSVLKMGDKLRVYFSTRAVPNESRTTFVDIDANNLNNILYIHDKPILENGKYGTFDEHGIMPSCALKVDEKYYLYYSGWSRRINVPYTNFSGLAVSDDGMNFKKISEGPILSNSIYDPYSATSPIILIHEKKFYMYYCSGTNWIKINGKYEHTYDIKIALSNDGINFDPIGKTAIKSYHELEAITRPTILKSDGMFHMWFCYRDSNDFRDGKGSYRIGYASSNDLINWNREDSKSGIDVSEEGWDSKMLAYPYIVDMNKETYLFYNGNGFGQSGFGYAVLEK